ncbi:MAG TPA: Hpt domain-containing protein [Gemmatimonadales bacterium]|jgi:HPt (histidine-containing phosphotransfer) domain-containing protein|nr:Hpt domain-containing protein [Gemmatimonadales bacterium]
MSAPLARREFFALEAGEYLERLTLLVQGDGTPDAENLVRYARALRGAALMAGPPGYAVAAAAIENVAKALRDGALHWSPALAEALSEAIESGKYLLRRLREWSEEEIARCEQTGSRLNDLVGAPSRRFPSADPRAPPTASAAVRAYIARETAALAATLEQAAHSVELSTPTSLPNVSQRLQPLRGLGALPGLSPLPELLEALELTLAHGGKGGAWPPAAGRAFRATAAALARIARDIASLGLTQAEAPEIVRASDSLREAFGGEEDVVPVESLFADHDQEAVLRRGSPPAPPQPAGNLAVELVGLADRLRHAASQLRSGPPGPARALQLHSLVFSLRGMSLSPTLRASAGELLSRLDREVMGGRVISAAERVAELLERASSALAAAAERGSAGELEAELAPLGEELDRLGGAEEPPVVPIESLAPEPADEIVPIESLAPSYSAFEQSFSTYYRLQYAKPAAPGREPPPLEPEPIPIQALLFRGRRALERADLVRRELGTALASQTELASIQTLLGELLDLVPLALDDSREPA